MLPRRHRGLALASALALLVILGLVLLPGWVVDWARPPRSPSSFELFPGVSYTRRPLEHPRPLMIHVVEIDLEAPGLSLFVTPGDQASLPARSTATFLQEFGLQVAVNGGFFDKYPAPGRRGATPRAGEAVNVKGQAISDGVVYSDDYPFLPVFCVTGSGAATIRRGGCPEGTVQGLAGNAIFVQDGRSVATRFWTANARQLHPRTAAALDETGGILWLVVVDGRQRGYSEGVNLAELAEIVIDLGAAVALNLDGGGSSTLVVEAGDQARLLNSPIHNRIPMRQRPVGNHLGLRVDIP